MAQSVRIEGEYAPVLFAMKVRPVNLATLRTEDKISSFLAGLFRWPAASGLLQAPFLPLYPDGSAGDYGCRNRAPTSCARH